MKFLEIAKELQNENKESIVLIRCGAFFVAIGKSAVFLSKKLNLKVNCISSNICKVGIPVTSIYKYIEKLETLNYNFVIYNYSKDEMVENGKKYAEAFRITGNKMEEEKENLCCENCERYKSKSVFDNITLFEDLKKLQEQNNKNE